VTADLALRAVVLLAIALAATRLLGRASAATRHACWRVAMAATLGLPLVTIVAPAWTLPTSVGQPAAAAFRSVGEWSGRVDAPRHDSSGRAEVAADEFTGGVDTRSGSGFPSPWSAGAIWLVGAALVSTYFVCGHVRLRRVRRRASPAPLVWAASASRLAARLRLHAAPAVAVSSEIAGPVVAGIWRPTVIVPPEAIEWSDTRRETVLLHELAHVARRDIAAQLVAHAVCALHWFNPLAWIAARAMRRERERACDDAVLGSGVVASTYAAELLAIAAGALTAPSPAAALSMARPSEIEGRLLSILARRPRRMSVVARFAVPLVASLSTVAIAGAATAAAGPDPVRADAPPQLRASSPLWVGLDTNLPAVRRESGKADDPHRDSTPESRERETVALALTAGTDVIPALIAALSDEHAGVREKAVVGLMWRRDARVVPALIDAAADEDGGVRKKAVVALALSGDGRARAVVEAARGDADPDVRDAARKLSLFY
jgi:hypothetical protein